MHGSHYCTSTCYLIISIFSRSLWGNHHTYCTDAWKDRSALPMWLIINHRSSQTVESLFISFLWKTVLWNLLIWTQGTFSENYYKNKIYFLIFTYFCNLLKFLIYWSGSQYHLLFSIKFQFPQCSFPRYVDFFFWSICIWKSVAP